jgi:O-acetyl-ADP-ribose deacetylase (regulator of RNase III)
MNTILIEKRLPSNQTIQIVQGDITIEAVDAIVNAANEYLQHGGGVARSIANKGGSIIQKESDAWVREHGIVSHKRPAWTSGGNLPAKYVIHAVGPTGIFGYPKDRAAAIIYFAMEKYFSFHSTTGINMVKLVLYDQPTVDVFLKSWQEKWGK